MSAITTINRLDEQIHIASDIIDNFEDLRSKLGEEKVLRSLHAIFTGYDLIMLELMRELKISTDAFEKRRRREDFG